VFVGVCLFFL